MAVLFDDAELEETRLRVSDCRLSKSLCRVKGQRKKGFPKSLVSFLESRAPAAQFHQVPVIVHSGGVGAGPISFLVHKLYDIRSS